MKSSMEHWRLSTEEKTSNMSLFNDLKEAKASPELVTTDVVSDMSRRSKYVALHTMCMRLLDLGKWRSLQDRTARSVGLP